MYERHLLSCYSVPGIMPSPEIINFILIYAFSFFSHVFLGRVIPLISSHSLPDFISKPFFFTDLPFNSHLSRIDNIFSTISTDGVKKNHSGKMNAFSKVTELFSSRTGMKIVVFELEAPATMQFTFRFMYLFICPCHYHDHDGHELIIQKISVKHVNNT